MKTQFLLFFFALLIVSCGRNRNSGVESEDTIPTAEIDFFVFNLEGGFAEDSKVTTLNELIDNITYIPLETSNDALLPGDHHAFAKIGSDMFINGGNFARQSPIYKFDSLGRFAGQITNIGRGPNEVVMPLYWYANANTGQINISDLASKIVIVQLESGEKSTINVHFSRGQEIVPLNDSTFVSAQMLSSQDIPNTYLYFIDRNGNLVHAIERNDELLNYNTSTSESAHTPPYERYWLVSDYKGDAIFHDIFNDTLYRIKSRSEITPHLVFKRGDLSPRPEDKQRPENKQKQAYFTHVMESGDHIFLSYTIGDKTWRDVWSKRTGNLLLHTVPAGPSYPFDFFVPYALPDGSLIDLQVVYADKDNIYCVMEALDACKFLPDVKEDDNPVIVIAKLKK